MTALLAPRTSVLPKRRGVDYRGLAEEHLLDAEIGTFEYKELVKDIAVLESRLAAGVAFRMNNPGKESAYRLYRKLEDDLRFAELARDGYATRIWHHCKSAYAALQHVTKPDHDQIVTHYNCHPLTSPCDLWNVLMPGVAAPGAWPPAKDEEHV